MNKKQAIQRIMKLARIDGIGNATLTDIIEIINKINK